MNRISGATSAIACQNPWDDGPPTMYIKPRNLAELHVCTGCFDLFTEVDKLDPKGDWDCPFYLMDCEVGFCYFKGWQLAPCLDAE